MEGAVFKVSREDFRRLKKLSLSIYTFDSPRIYSVIRREPADRSLELESGVDSHVVNEIFEDAEPGGLVCQIITGAAFAIGQQR